MFDFIKKWFFKKELDNELDSELDKEIMKMSVDEYNIWLSGQKDIQFKNSCKKLETILYKAWEDHIYRCKKNRERCGPIFVLRKDDYNISIDDILLFFCNKTVIGDFEVRCSSEGLEDYLVVERI